MPMGSAMTHSTPGWAAAAAATSSGMSCCRAGGRRPGDEAVSHEWGQKAAGQLLLNDGCKGPAAVHAARLSGKTPLEVQVRGCKA